MREFVGIVFVVLLLLIAGCSGTPSDDEPGYVPSDGSQETTQQPTGDGAPSSTTSSTSDFDDSTFRNVISKEFNQARNTAGLSQLQYRQDWEDVADSVAMNLAEERGIRNNLIESSKTFNATYRLEQKGYQCQIETEGAVYTAGSYYAQNWMYRDVNTTDGIRYFTDEENLATFMTNRQMLSGLNQTERDEVDGIVYRPESKYHTVGVYVDDQYRVWVAYIVC